MGIPISLLKRQVTSTQFIQLCKALDRKRKRRTTDHHYFAEMLLRLDLIRNPKSKAKDPKKYLLEFEKKKELKSPERRLADSKTFWKFIAGNPQDPNKRKGKK